MATMATKPKKRQPARVYGNTPVEMDDTLIKSQQTKTEDEIVEMAESIYRQVQAAGLDKSDTKAVDAQLKSMWAGNEDFAKEFPVIFRWTVQAQEFRTKVFRHYMRNEHRAFWKKRKDMLLAQVEYLVNLRRAGARENRAPISNEETRAYRERMRKLILEEDEAFLKASEEADKEIERRQRVRLERLQDFVRQQAVGFRRRAGLSD